MYHLYPKRLVENYTNINSIVPNINCGGCGIFAEALYNSLTKLGNKPKLIVLTNNPTYMRLCIREDIGINSLWHIIVKVGNYYYDSNGRFSSVSDIIKKYDYPNLTCVDVPIERLAEWNKDKSIWNSKFNRAHINKVHNVLNTITQKIQNKTK
jgi:hypothetical protein